MYFYIKICPAVGLGEGFEDAFEHHLAGDFAVGGFGDYQRAFALYHLIGHNHIAAHRQAVHEVGVASAIFSAVMVQFISLLMILP